LKLARTLSGLVNESFGLIPGKIDLMWKAATPRIAHPTNRNMTRSLANNWPLKRVIG
jgi:hypothetical protein